MKTRLFFASTFMFLFNIIYSQTTVSNENRLSIPREVSLEERLEGTYEVIITNSKITEAFTTDLLNVIETKREESRDVVYVLSPYTSIRIFSRQKINSPEFKK